jgi:hypothetical protein
VSALPELQAAIFARLNGDERLAGRVHDEVPQDTTGEYLVIGEGTARPGGTHTTRGREDTLTLHGWSDARGTKKLSTMMAVARELLDGYALVVPGYRTIACRWEFSEVLREPGGRHAVDRYRIRLEKLS